MKYFAYGVNMNHQKMAGRCPGATFLGRARLDGYRLFFDGKSLVRPGAVANIEPQAGSVVWGGLYEITPADLEQLDAFERYPTAYQRKEFDAVDDGGVVHQAIAYFRTGEVPGEPGESYLNELLEGAADCGLPEDYIAGLRH